MPTGFPTGITKLKYYCKDCGKQLSGYRATRCKSCSKLGKGTWNYIDGRKNRKVYCRECGKLLSLYTCTYCLRCRYLGERNNKWKGGITPLYEAIRKLPEYKEWRTRIFRGDKYTCQKCPESHNNYNKTIQLEAHHSEKSFSELLAEFLQEYNQFSPYEDQHILLRLAMKWQPFWTAKGETLCKDCHTLTFKENPAAVEGLV